MIMNEYITKLNFTLRISFWRSAAFLTGVGVRHRRIIRHILYLAPIGLAALVSYLLGRFFGEILLWSLSF